MKGRIGTQTHYLRDLSIVLCLITKSNICKTSYEDPFNAGTDLLHLFFFKISRWTRIFISRISVERLDRILPHGLTRKQALVV